jgi:hypothetical protein
MGKPTVWLNDGGVAMPADPEDVRCGAHRASMASNVLIAKPEIGQVKKSSFVQESPERIYGMPSPHGGESAKEGGCGWPPPARPLYQRRKIDEQTPPPVGCCAQ